MSPTHVRELTLSGLLAAVLLAGCGGGSSGDGSDEDTGDPTTGSALFADLAVCPREEGGDAGCPVDQSDSPLETPDVLCSAQYSGESGSMTIRLDHDGREVFTKDIADIDQGVAGDDPVPVTGFFGTGDLPIPGGSYTCSFDDGEDEASLDFESSGESGPAAYLYACDEADTEEDDNSVFCTEDYDTLSGVQALTCSTVLTDILGSAVDVRLAITGSDVDDEATLELSGKSPLGILVAHATIDGARLTGEAGAPVPPGTYACEWLVDGEPVGETSVDVTD